MRGAREIGVGGPGCAVACAKGEVFDGIYRGLPRRSVGGASAPTEIGGPFGIGEGGVGACNRDGRSTWGMRGLVEVIRRDMMKNALMVGGWGLKSPAPRRKKGH